MAENTQRPIIVKRKKRAAGGHHGGAWKIAYADFVTAMMAFFLLMWLLGSTTKGELLGIADYFQTPLKIAFGGGSGSGEATSIITGGGKDLTRREMQQLKSEELPNRKRTIDVKAAQAEVTRLENGRLQALKSKIEQLIDAEPLLKQYRNQLLIDITSEGLRIQIVDDMSRPMFDLGSAALKPYARDILTSLSKPLNDVSNRISVTGHTDATPFASGERGYSNWELSADRANASRRALVSGGIDDGKIKRVVGMASAVLFDEKDSHNPVNRRISIIVLTRQAEESMNRVSGASNIGKDPAKEGDNEPATDGAAAPTKPAGGAPTKEVAGAPNKEGANVPVKDAANATQR